MIKTGIGPLLLAVIVIATIYWGVSESRKRQENAYARTQQAIAIIAEKQKEQWYTDHINDLIAGDTKITLPDGTRPDIVTDVHAIEVDFVQKFYEAIGQAAHYARLTEKRPAIWLIETSEDDTDWTQRAIETTKKVTVDINGEPHHIALFILRARPPARDPIPHKVD